MSAAKLSDDHIRGCVSGTSTSRVPLAVFDYDGTCISGQSGALVTYYLFRHGYLSFLRSLALGWWGVRYKLHLPCCQEEARELMFASLRKRRPAEVASVMAQFHDEVLQPLYRPAAIAEIERRRCQGCMTLLVTATYDEIASVAVAYLGADAFLATEMERDDTGWYTGNINGTVVAGNEKLRAVIDWANEHLGCNRWYLAAAYGDHHTDAPMLAAAMEPAAVCPTHTLAVEARKRGWPRLDWSVARAVV